MASVFDYFTVVSNLVKYVSWSDLNSFKKLNSLCAEVSDREIAHRCSGITSGFFHFKKPPKQSGKRRKTESSDSLSILQSNLKCKNPKLILIMSSVKENLNLSEIIESQCDHSATICYVFSSHGIFGLNDHGGFDRSFSSRNPGISWLCFPDRVQAELLTAQSPIRAHTKLVLVFNDCCASNCYSTGVLPDNGGDGYSDAAIEKRDPNAVLYGGGIVNSIDVYNHAGRRFDRMESVSIAISGADVRVDACVLDEEHEHSARDIQSRLEGLQTRNRALLATGTVQFQCVLVLSCFLRRPRRPPSRASGARVGPEGGDVAAAVNEYEMVARALPGVPLCGVLCQGEIFRVLPDGVIKLVKALASDDIDGGTSVIVLLSWTTATAAAAEAAEPVLD